MTSRPTNWVNCCSRCRVEFSWVQLYRYKHPLSRLVNKMCVFMRVIGKEKRVQSTAFNESKTWSTLQRTQETTSFRRTPCGAPDRTTKAVELKLVQQHVALVVRDMLKTAVERQCQYTMGQFRSTATNDADWSSNGGAAKSARSSVRECR